MGNKSKSEENYQQWMKDLETVAKIGRWEIQVDERITKWSDGVFKIFEISNQQTPSYEEHINFYQKDYRELIETSFSNLIEKKEIIDLEAQITTKKGNLKWVHILGEYFDENTLFGTIQDITTDKYSELQMHLLINNTEESFVLVGLDFKVITVNRQFELEYLKQFGKKIEVGESILNFATPDRRERLKEIYNSVFSGENLEDELVLNTEGGKKVFKLTYKPAKNIQNQITGAFVNIKDITDEEEIKNNLINSEQRFRALVENGTEGTAILDESGNPKYITPSIQGMLGYTLDEIYSKNLMELTHPDDVHKVQEKFMDSLDKPGITLEGALARIKHKDGSWRWFDAIITNLLHEPSINGIVDNFRDVTDKVEAENKLESVLQKLEKHLDNSPLGIVEYDSELYITKWSEKCQEIFGWSEEEVLSKRMNAFDLIYKEDVSKATKIVEELKSDEIHGNTSVNRNNTKSGIIVDCIWYNSTIRDKNGDVETIMSLVQDVSKDVEAEKKVQESIKEKTILLAEVHHRVKNNLAIVSGLLQLQAFNTTDNHLMKALFDSVSRIKSIALVHEQLYNSNDFANVRIDKNIRKLVNHLSSIMSRENNIEVEYELEETELNINQAIPTALFINEAVTNVYKHAFQNDSGGVLKIYCSEVKGAITIGINDNGIGFDQKILAETKDSQSLGFQLLEMVTQQLSGDLSIESNNGTTIKLSFLNGAKQKGSSAGIIDFKH
tara:strand:+ start:27347 stop:29527 length:2181 start_codon:yes stop_codon:yes gene_type:complete